jgi:hypothetical protein
MIYIQAVYQTFATMGPQYLLNTYNWLKAALWDAPQRFMLDVELEKISIEREEYLSENDSPEK